MTEVIKFLQRVLNPGAIERLAAQLNIKIPVGQILGMYLAQLVPVVGAPLVEKIKNNYDWFIHAPADQVAAALGSGMPGGLELTEDICFNLFGTRVCYKADSNKTMQIILGIGLAATLGYLFLRAK